MYERGEREVLSRWPNNLIRKVKKLKKRNEVGLLKDIRTSLLLSGIAERLPADLNPETIDCYENPLLSRHLMTTHRSSLSPKAVVLPPPQMKTIRTERQSLSMQKSAGKSCRAPAGDSSRSQSHQSSSFSSHSYISAKRKTAKRRGTTIHTGSVNSQKEHNFRRINQFAVQRRLGKGQFGSVYLCLNMQEEHMVAMKVIKRRKQRQIQ